MPVAPEWSGRMIEPAPRPVRFEIPVDLAAIGPAVEQVIAACRAHLPDGADGVEIADCVALALTEALNNCVEHAYLGTGRGRIVIETELPPGALVLHVSDRGRPPPLATVRVADMPDPEDLPESGWGWALIHRLTDRVDYARRDGWNRLTLERRFWRYYEPSTAWTRGP